MTLGLTIFYVCRILWHRIGIFEGQYETCIVLHSSHDVRYYIKIQWKELCACWIAFWEGWQKIVLIICISLQGIMNNTRALWVNVNFISISWVGVGISTTAHLKQWPLCVFVCVCVYACACVCSCVRARAQVCVCVIAAFAVPWVI